MGLESATAPLVSCIMPTRNRPHFVRQACEYFRRQSFTDAELIVVADGAPLDGHLPPDPRIRLVLVPDHRSIGHKRNAACAFAKGRVIVAWDDDDWYGPGRLEAQVRPILDGACDITLLRCDRVLVLPPVSCWRPTEAEHRRLFDRHGAAGTMAFRRELWARRARFPDASVAEDIVFIRDAANAGARVLALPGAPHFVYVRHGMNTWAAGDEEIARGSGAWIAADPPDAMRSDLPFYERLVAERERPAGPPRAPAAAGRPLVSCVMPTRDRPSFVESALQYFERQDYEPRELLVLDDGAVPVGALCRGRAGVRYVRVDSALRLGRKRNLGCELAHGAVIAHWDDDDWYGPRRLSYQVGALLDSGASVCGLDDVRFLDTATGRAWRYSYRPSGHAWLSGATLCYHRAVWPRHGFPDVSTGEDNRFVAGFAESQVLALEDHTFFVGVVHERNTSRKDFGNPHWQPIPVAEIARQIGADIHRYAGNVPTPAGR